MRTSAQRLNADDKLSASEARAFCLRMIKEFYDIDYTESWHGDLDSLLSDGSENWFSEPNRGSFYHARDASGSVVAVGGLYDLRRKPSTQKRIGDRYDQNTQICQIVRVYLDAKFRGNGIGGEIAALLECDALRFGYDVCYLHADAQTASTLNFWKKCGYQDFGRFSTSSDSGTYASVDFEKYIDRQ